MKKQELLQSLVEEWDDVTQGTGKDPENPERTQDTFVTFRLEQEQTMADDPTTRQLATLLLKERKGVGA